MSIHGHEMLYNYMPEPKARDVLIEVGSTRDVTIGQDSSSFFAGVSRRTGCSFISVDMDSRNTRRFNEKHRCGSCIGVNEKGEDFLAKFVGKIDFLYLDAFDFFHRNHSEERLSRYRIFLNTDINNRDCHKMHLDACRVSWRKLAFGGMVCFDDIYNPVSFHGKGKTAVPFLLKRGYVALDYQPNALLLFRPRIWFGSLILSYSLLLFSFFGQREYSGITKKSVRLVFKIGRMFYGIKGRRF